MWPNCISYDAAIFRVNCWLSKIARKIFRANLKLKLRSNWDFNSSAYALYTVAFPWCDFLVIWFLASHIFQLSYKIIKTNIGKNPRFAWPETCLVVEFEETILQNFSYSLPHAFSLDTFLWSLQKNAYFLYESPFLIMVLQWEKEQ